MWFSQFTSRSNVFPLRLCILTVSIIFIQETHELKVHQLVVQLEGWEQVSPVSVDKVGAFFRQAMPAKATGKVSHNDYIFDQLKNTALCFDYV